MGNIKNLQKIDCFARASLALTQVIILGLLADSHICGQKLLALIQTLTSKNFN